MLIAASLVPLSFPGGRDLAGILPELVLGGAFLLLMMWRTPPWLVVLICAAGGQFLAALP